MVCTVTAAVLAHVAPWTPEKLHVLYVSVLDARLVLPQEWFRSYTPTFAALALVPMV
jgi:hypothetical protein